jgi:hypothetical protein
VSEEELRPIKLPFPATAIVWASKVVSLPEGAVWFQVWALDRCICRGQLLCDCGAQADRCYAGAAAIADRLGISPRTVEDYLGALGRRRMVLSFPRKSGRNNGRIATIPIRLPAALTLKAVPQVRDLLDQHLADTDAWSKRSTGKAASPPTESTASLTTERDVLTVESEAAALGGRGDAVSSALKNVSDAPTSSLSISEDGTEAKDGAFARELEQIRTEVASWERAS